MTRDDVIWMAREANRYADTHADSTDCDWPLVRDEHFAELVAAAENEACEKLADMAEPYQAADLIRARRKA